ncbi:MULTISPECIES: hypothetical protein [Streptomyces]|uniref:Secreted protein n=1 Tax=Streptomyces hydrogenans TaxID=1873719 RepID=A0ABQ3PP00_9ACTN|nr:MULTISPECIES: hypothetical protein [Streptomyces]MCM1949801.1 hypothetical protein [Streptomyces sp. G2]GHI26740.1 hypothetical protein Shyd_81110 [Streptomyces hydrogenans]
MKRGTLIGAGAALALAAVAAGAAGDPDTRRARRAAAGAWPPMPDFRGGGLWRVFTRLDHRTRLDVHDASGRDRRVLWPPRWRVCTQYPSAGTGLDRRTTVVIGVLRKGEPCPVRVTSARR